MSAVADAEPATTTPPPAVWDRPRVELLAGLLVGLESGRRVTASGVSSAEYEHLLAVRFEHRRGVRLTYDDGELEVMSHGSRHEIWKGLIGMLLGAAAMGFRLPMAAYGNVTLRRASRRKGLEPDQCYYVQREPLVRGAINRDLDFETDPPPDLAVEVEISRRAIPKLPLSATLGVPEVWRWDGDALTVLHLTPGGSYAEAAVSLAFPLLPPAVLASYLARAGTVDHTTLARELLDWATDAYAARTAPTPPGTA